MDKGNLPPFCGNIERLFPNYGLTWKAIYPSHIKCQEEVKWIG